MTRPRAQQNKTFWLGSSAVCMIGTASILVAFSATITFGLEWAWWVFDGRTAKIESIAWTYFTGYFWFSLCRVMTTFAQVGQLSTECILL